MAMVSRAPRDTSLSRSTTDANVGPGSYGGPDVYTVNHGYAPFGGTDTRSMRLTASKDVTPGPGSYHSQKEQARQLAASSSFVSQEKRFQERTEGNNDAPGPGSYNPPSKWGKNSSHRPPNAGGGNESGGGGQVSWVRVATVPSVPTRDQSYGYEESDRGELIQQKPPEGQYSGKGRDIVGPGHYDPSVEFLGTMKNSRSAPAFGKSRSSRSKVSGSNNPGPGTYNSSITIRDPQDKKPSAAFVSKVRRPYEVDPSEDVMTAPGPGAYNPMLGSMTRPYVPETLQFFGSTTKRPWDNAREGRRSRSSQSPGPGSYKNTLTAFPKKAILSMTEAAPFSTTAGRFAGNSTVDREEKPGPGSYAVDTAMSLVTELKKKPVGRRGVFGTTADRWNAAEPTAEMPGPGTYAEEVEGAASGSSKEREKEKGKRVGKPLSSFASRTVRGDKQKESAPPPGAYEVPSAFSSSTRKKYAGGKVNAVFNTSSERLGGNSVLGQRPTNTPGPGEYGNVVPTSKKHFSKAKSQTTAPRFGSTRPARVPGPGQYSHAVPLVKKSFNITIDEHYY
jgi:hypothetical protein